MDTKKKLEADWERLKEEVKGRLNSLRFRGIGIDESGSAEWDDDDGGYYMRDFRSFDDDVFQAHEDEEDDDWPEFVGEDIVQEAAEAHFKGLNVRIESIDQEKNWFSVAVYPLKAKVKKTK